MLFERKSWVIFLAAVTIFANTAAAAETFRVATYNLNNYFLTEGDSRPLKSIASQQQIHKNILAFAPDILAVEEMSNATALKHLQDELKAGGLDLPDSEIITGGDTNIHVAVLSRFPIVARHPHTNESYLLHGRRFHVERGILEVDIQITPNYHLTVMAAHLKSKRPVPVADQAEMRLMEATILREKIDAQLQADPDVNLVVLGDFNDTKNSQPIRTIRGRGRKALMDTRPAEQNGDTAPPLRPTYDPPNITWTYFYGAEDSYTRVDYIMLSPGLAQEWVKDETYVFAAPNWGLASDHRPIVATFEVGD